MNDKEFNRSILAKLYEIADKVFAEGVNVPEGCYTASELVKIGKKERIFKAEYIKIERIKKAIQSYYGGTTYKYHVSEVAPIFGVKVGDFECSFCASKVFDLVARFEKLAGVSKANQHLFSILIDTANEIGSVTVWIDKRMAEMAKFCDQGKLTLHKAYKQIAIDFRNRKIVATDGRILNVRKLRVIEATGKIYEKIYPLVEFNEFARLCKNAGKNGAAIKCSLIEENGKQFWVCGGSKVEAKNWTNYLSLFDGGIIENKLVSLNDSEWEKVAKWLKKNNKIEPTGCVFVHHEEGADTIRFVIKYSNSNTEYTVKCASVPREAFIMCFQRKNLLTACKSFHLDISHKWKWAYNLCKGCVSIIMPSCFPSECDGLDFDWEITGEKVNVFEYCGFDDNAQETPTEAKEVVEAYNSSVVDKEVQCKDVFVPQNELSERKEIVPERNTENTRKTKDNSKRITLYSIGLRNGDELQFADGQVVTVCSEKKVAYEGKEYTLSGFTKAFITKQNKSGTYRGIMYFYKDGVRLDKYAEAYFASEESNKGTDPVLPKEQTAPNCITTPTETPLANETSVIVATPCNECVVTSKTVGFNMPVSRISEPNLIGVAVLLNIFFVPRTERNHLVVHRLPEILRVWGGRGNKISAICFTRIVPHNRRTTPVHALCNPPPYICPMHEKNRVIRRLCELFTTQKMNKLYRYGNK